MLTAIIVAGGSSRRMGFDKTFALLAGKPVIAHSVAAFDACESVHEIIVVARDERLDECRGVLGNRFGKLAAVVCGGAERQDSVAAGLARVSPESKYVAVHDAARPLIAPVEITRVFEAAQGRGAAALAAPVTDTLKRADADGFVDASIDRAHVYAMQTPQIFARELLLEAYKQVAAEKLMITDEVSAVQHLGRRVMLVCHERPNLKITYPEDIRIAELVMGGR